MVEKVEQVEMLMIQRNQSLVHQKRKVKHKNLMESQRARVRYQTEISRLIEREVDLVFLREAGELLSYQILSKGQVVVETDKEIHRSFRAYRLIKCLDFQFLEDRMKRGMVTAMKEDIIG